MQRTIKTAVAGLAFFVVIGSSAISFQPPAQEAEPAPAENAAAEGEEAAAAGDGDLDAVMALGEELYVNNCAACHGVDGTGPERPFVGNTNLEYAVVIASQVIHGGEFMPRFRELTDEQIAAIGTYIRNSWGNEMGPVTAEEIGQYR